MIFLILMFSSFYFETLIFGTLLYLIGFISMETSLSLASDLSLLGHL